MIAVDFLCLHNDRVVFRCIADTFSSVQWEYDSGLYNAPSTVILAEIDFTRVVAARVWFLAKSRGRGLVLFSIVRAHVPVEVAGLREADAADLAFVRFFPAVDSNVLGERRRVGEGFLADVALVGPFSGVCPSVRRDRRRLREASVADVAFERFFARVRAQVSA